MKNFLITSTLIATLFVAGHTLAATCILSGPTCDSSGQTKDGTQTYRCKQNTQIKCDSPINETFFNGNDRHIVMVDSGPNKGIYGCYGDVRTATPMINWKPLDPDFKAVSCGSPQQLNQHAR